MATRQKLHGKFSARRAAASGEMKSMVADAALTARQIETVKRQVDNLRKAATEADCAYRAANLDQRGYLDVIISVLAKERGISHALERLQFERQLTTATSGGAGMPGPNRLRNCIGFIRRAGKGSIAG
jgi:vacuolar-type H+-ATPase subunit I/STV1